jgi:hypothetical protein
MLERTREVKADIAAVLKAQPHCAEVVSLTQLAALASRKTPHWLTPRCLV